MITTAMAVAGLAALAALGAAGLALAGPRLVLPLGRFTFPRVKVKPSAKVAPGVEWLDDYFTVQRIDTATLAIGEPRYFQQNHSYLILGRERALLFDAGAGPRDIAPAVGALTALPVTATCSHLHYDHSANLHRFSDVRLLDVPALRAAVLPGSGGGEVLVPPPDLHLGALERVPAREVRVSGWVAPGSTIDLGGRRLTALHAPGHTPDGMALLDRERNQLFAGDLIYPLGAYAFGPGADVQAYARTLGELLELIDDETRILVAHPGRIPVVSAPVMSRGDLSRLHAGMLAVLEGSARWSGLYPRRYRVDEKMWVRTDAVLRRSRR